MIGVQNHNGHDKPFLGCLGHVVNLFDLSAGMTGNRMPMDKSHRKGSPLSRSRSDVSGMSLVEDQIQDKLTISELQRNSSNRTVHGTPVKMLIAEEMSKEVESKKKQPNVVAKLMGLEARPFQQSETQKCHSRGSSRSQSCVSFGSWQEEHELHQHQEQNDHINVYEIQHSDNRYVRNKLPQKESFNRDIIDKKMALVRQNFIELKRLSTDEKLRQSKQFRDALEVLSSNKDSFLQFLQEPNSMFSQQLSDLQSVSPPYETKRITILKPAKMVDGYSVTGSPKMNEKKINKNSHFSQISRLHKNGSGFSPQTSCKPENSQGHTTRIVVLKPAPGKPREIKDDASPLSSKPKASRVEDPYVVVGNDDAQESSEVAKEINRQMAENLSQHRRDEILHPSVLSNGFTGNESSSNKSEIEYAVENLSDPEAISPTSRHSWSYINRFDSPYMLSSFSRASNSPESSVCREAKKRLSERWAMMASDGSQEQKHVRSSSTLGEMLALSDMKKRVITKEDCLTNKQHFRGSTSCFTSELNDEDKCNTPARNILRSKSVPVSSMVYSGGVLNPEVSDPKMEKTDIPKDLTKTRSMKSFLKGRVSSLFFSRNNKSSKQKVNSSREEFESTELARHCLESDVDIGVEAGEIPDLLGSGNKSSPLQSLDEETIEDRVYTKAAFSATKLCPFRGPIEKQGQPNPVSVLEPPFQEDDHREPGFTDNFSLLRNGFDLPVCPVKSNLIDKSPLVGSINARTLSWNDSCTENLSPYHSKSYAVQVSAEGERQEMFFLVQTLLAAAELGNESLCDTFLARWHSLESPLDPLLRDIYAGLNVKETLHEAKRIPRRSMQKLVFDCVNAALVELAMYGSDPWKSGTCWLHDQGSIVDYVWTQMEWFSGEVSCVKGGGMEHNSLAVERLVRKEVVGKSWADHTRLEIDNFCKEIEVNLLEELVQETVEEFTVAIATHEDGAAIPALPAAAAVTTKVQQQQQQGGRPRAFFVFGDSLVDNGNNNYLFTTARADSPPYGIDSPTHSPSGRFSNGLNIPDLISEKLGGTTNTAIFELPA